MKWVRRWTRRLVLWIGPGLISLFFILVCFLAWAIATQAGSRWVLHTAVQLAGGQVSGVRGSIWRGLDINSLNLALPEATVKLEDFSLKADWLALLERRLHIRELAVLGLSLELHESSDDSSEEEFSFPVLPVQVAVDRLYVGEFHLEMNNEVPPVHIVHIETALALGNHEAQLVFRDLALAVDDIHVGMTGEARLLALADPWPMSMHLNIEAHSDEERPMLCLRDYVPDLPSQTVDGRQDALSLAAHESEALPELSRGFAWPALKDIEDTFKLWRKGARRNDEPTIVRAEEGHAAPLCTVRLATSVSGSLDELAIAAQGGGQGVDLDLAALLRPRTPYIVQEAAVKLDLADGSSLAGNVDWVAQMDAGDSADDSLDRLTARLTTHSLDLAILGISELPQGLITASVSLDANMRNQSELLSADFNLEIDPATRWNQQAASGHIHSSWQAGSGIRLPLGTESGEELHWQNVIVRLLDVDLVLGNNHVGLRGALGSPGSEISLDVAVGQLADFWPDLPGGLLLKGRLGGTLASHMARLEGRYTSGADEEKLLGTAPISLDVDLTGRWGALSDKNDGEGWQASIRSLVLDHAGVQLGLLTPMPLTLAPEASHPAWQWQAGATSIQLRLPSGAAMTLHNQLSRGGDGRWETRGNSDQLVISQAIIDEVQGLLATEAEQTKEDRGRIILKDVQNQDLALVHRLDWDLSFARALAGTVRLERVSGDLLVPGDPPFPLGLEELKLLITARPASGGSSQLTADLDIATKEMGHARITGNTLVHASPDGGFSINEADPKTVRVIADISHLDWLSLLAGDEMEFGGSLRADVQAHSRPGGLWAATGDITGSAIRIVRVDDGVRLLDGELAARFDNNRVILDRLYFPAVLRVTPKEWRTAEWVQTNPDAKDGHLTITGGWNLLTSEGSADIEFYRYPLLQRTDRYAMVSGELHVEVPFPQVAVSGKLVADAGWVDLDMLSSVPTLDSDVVVLRPGDEDRDVTDGPVDVSLDLTVDLGPRFYITGFGLDSGLVGQLRIIMADGDLRGQGILRTRGGAIEAYGQRLRLRQGSITFQGDLTDPILNIEALRTGLQVEAGVQVLGTARRPHIDLVSYPDVSDVQKLSWLLLGRGPEDSGGDAMLLLSVGTSFLSGGEPFYRKFGIDELSLQSGELGSAGSILPAESVVSGLASGTSTIERQFVVASKAIGRGFTLSLEQALSGTGTVGRASYRLMRGLTAELSVGTVTGLALIYRKIFGF